MFLMRAALNAKPPKIGFALSLLQTELRKPSHQVTPEIISYLIRFFSECVVTCLRTCLTLSVVMVLS